MKNMAIDAFLNWAFVQELWKVAASGDDAPMALGFGRINEFAEIGALIDRTPNEYGLVPGFLENDGPHPDAIMAGKAVQALPDIELPEDWQPFPDWADPHGTVGEAVAAALEVRMLQGAVVRRRQLINLVASCAILDRPPSTCAVRPEDEVVRRYGNPAWFVRRKAKDTFGRIYEFEAEGYDARKRRVKPGAYQKYRLAEPITAAIGARMDCFLWLVAMKHLKQALAGRLTDHMIRASAFEASITLIPTADERLVKAMIQL